jgi:16S rRNA A1518/A1519 N6-dimethyltransferase RsmA/KsgA/DIM1 with predicted DNA glycosylase/AP lyase activity
VLEVGAGSGLATRDLVAAGCQVTALEPGERLARRLFSTFSSWTPAEIEAAATAADRCGGRVTEHYRSILHVLEATPGH